MNGRKTLQSSTSMFKLFCNRNVKNVSVFCAVPLAFWLGGCGDQERLSVGGNPNLRDHDAGADAAEAQLPSIDAGGLTLQVGVNGEAASAAMICQGECVELSALVLGARSALTYEWSDGALTSAASGRICPTQSMRVELTVAETGADTELSQPRSASAALSLQVRECADAGGELAAEAGASLTQGLCLKNASFEDIATMGEGFRTDEWTSCHDGAHTATEDRLFYTNIPLVPAAHGKNMVALHATHSNASLGIDKPSITQALCLPMRANEPHSLRLAALSYGVPALIPLPNDRGRVQIFGTMNECETGELLWQSDYLGNGTQWVTLCASFTPKQAYPYVRLGIETDDGNGRLVTLDDLRPLAASESCN